MVKDFIANLFLNARCHIAQQTALKVGGQGAHCINGYHGQQNRNQSRIVGALTTHKGQNRLVDDGFQEIVAGDAGQGIEAHTNQTNENGQLILAKINQESLKGAFCILRLFNAPASGSSGASGCFLFSHFLPLLSVEIQTPLDKYDCSSRGSPAYQIHRFGRCLKQSLDPHHARTQCVGQ